MPQEIAAEKPATEGRGQSVAAIDCPAGRWSSLQAPSKHGEKVSVGVEVVQWAMLGKALGEIAALDGVKKQAAVGTVEQPAKCIEGEPKEIAPSLAEQLEPVRRRMIPPAPLLELDPANATGCRTAVHPVQPAVGAPRQVIGQRLGILHAKPLEQHSGWTVGNIVPVAVGIEEQIGNLQDKNTAISEGQPGGQVQPVNEIPGPIGPAIAVGVLENRDPVGSTGPPRWRLGNTVVDSPRPAIDFHPLQPGRVGILQVLDRPQPATIVALDQDRLPHHGLAGEQLHLETLGECHLAGGRLQRVPLGPCGPDRQVCQEQQDQAPHDHSTCSRSSGCQLQSSHDLAF